MFEKQQIKCGDILWVQFNPSVGHEFQDKRPALVVQANAQLVKFNLVTVVPLTSNTNNKIDDDIIVYPDDRNCLRSVSVIKVRHIESFDLQRIYGKLGEASEKVMNDVKKYLKIHFGI